jgi:hypothetical protein
MIDNGAIENPVLFNAKECFRNFLGYRIIFGREPSLNEIARLRKDHCVYVWALRVFEAPSGTPDANLWGHRPINVVIESRHGDVFSGYNRDDPRERFQFHADNIFCNDWQRKVD